MLIHASCVALDGRAVLVTGASGSGKSGLALQLMAFGARLVADDRTLLHRRDGALWATCPDTIRGRIEARGMGILAADAADTGRVVLAVDLDHVEPERMPPPRHIPLLDVAIPLFHKVESLHFAPAILQYLRKDPPLT